MAKAAWTLLILLALVLSFNSAQAERTVYAGGLLDGLEGEPLVLPPPSGQRVPETPGRRPQVPPDRPIRHEPLVLPEDSNPRRPTPPRPQPAGTPSEFRRFEKYDVWKPFYDKFKRCEPGCEPRVNNLHRPGDGGCHGEGRAIDIDGIVCPGSTHSVWPHGRPNARFEQMVRCMRDQQGMVTLWKNKDPHVHGVGKYD